MKKRQVNVKQVKSEPASDVLVKVEPMSEEGAPKIAEEQRDADVQMDKSELIRMGHQRVHWGLDRTCRTFDVIMFVSRW